MCVFECVRVRIGPIGNKYPNTHPNGSSPKCQYTAEHDIICG